MSAEKFFRYSTKLFNYYIPREFIFLVVIEFLILIVSLYLAFEIRFWSIEWQHFNFDEFLPKALVYAIVLQLSMVAFGAYQRQSGRFFNMLVLRIASGLLLGLIPLGVSYYFVPQFFLGRGALLIAVALSFIFIVLIRLFFIQVLKEDRMWSRVLVLGAGKRAQYIHDAVIGKEIKGLHIIGYVAMPGDKEVITGNIITLDKSLLEYVEEHDIDEIVLAMDDRRNQGISTKELIDCKMSGINILDLVTFFERRAGKIRLDMLNPSWLYLSEGFQVSGMFRSVDKRILDIIVVLILLPLALPFMALVSIAILIESFGRGPILYSQTRVKQDGLLFKIYKFRSMVTDAEKDGVARWASKNDTRITRVGRFIRKSRLDELPQLFNVLKGDMSFVGPRPERPEFVKQLAEKIPYYEERHRVKPGLTGWAQICYSYGDTEEDGIQKLQYDLYYVKNYSVLLDLLILLQTAEVVLLGKGAQ
jgi:sugar transferase (PEP-CTERM system associated)